MKPCYQDDAVTLYHGDCVDVLPAAGVKADLILTSPPYDGMREFGGHGFDFDLVADACVGALADGGVLVWVVADATVDGSETGTSFRQALGFMERGLRLHDTMIYEKSSLSAFVPTRYLHCWDYMFVFTNGPLTVANIIADKPNFPNQTWRPRKTRMQKSPDGIKSTKYGERYAPESHGRRTNIWRYKTGVASAGSHSLAAPDFLGAHEHPAIFPLALAKDHIRTWTNPGDVVLDPMAGSGTVLRAAKDLGRTAIGVEIHEDYLPIITGRMAQSVMALA